MVRHHLYSMYESDLLRAYCLPETNIFFLILEILHQQTASRDNREYLMLMQKLLSYYSSYTKMIGNGFLFMLFH